MTGATSGIGLGGREGIHAAHGARVILAVRDAARGHAAAATCGAWHARGPAARPRQPRLGAAPSPATGPAEPIDLLINDAGVMMPSPLTRTTDGFELQFGTDHLGHFALTNLLLPHVTGRVVTVSAADAHKFGRIDFDDLNWERGATAPGAPTASPSWPTCCSPPNCSAA